MVEDNLFKLGFKHGIPIGLGYLTVSISIGIVCQSVGLNVLQSALISLFNNASAGEYAGLTVISEDAGLIEIIIITLIVNARYLLMSCALSQKIDESVPTWKRMIIGFDVTDELFGISIARPNKLEPSYFFGAMILPLICWCSGTVIGLIIGNLLPSNIVSAFTVTLFGMFIAVIMPKGKEDKVVLGCILISFALSYIFDILPFLSNISSGTKTIILTIVISALAALIFPKEEEE